MTRVGKGMSLTITAPAGLAAAAVVKMGADYDQSQPFAGVVKRIRFPPGAPWKAFYFRHRNVAGTDTA